MISKPSGHVADTDVPPGACRPVNRGALSPPPGKEEEYAQPRNPLIREAQAEAQAEAEAEAQADEAGEQSRLRSSAKLRPKARCHHK